MQNRCFCCRNRRKVARKSQKNRRKIIASFLGCRIKNCSVPAFFKIAAFSGRYIVAQETRACLQRLGEGGLPQIRYALQRALFLRLSCQRCGEGKFSCWPTTSLPMLRHVVGRTQICFQGLIKREQPKHHHILPLRTGLSMKHVYSFLRAPRLPLPQKQPKLRPWSEFSLPRNSDHGLSFSFPQ